VGVEEAVVDVQTVCRLVLRECQGLVPDSGLPLDPPDSVLWMVSLPHTQYSGPSTGYPLTQWLGSLQLDRSARILWPGPRHTQCSLSVSPGSNPYKELLPSEEDV